MTKWLVRLWKDRVARVVITLMVSHIASIFLLVARSVDAGNSRYYFLTWNMFLAIVPIVLSFWLRKRLNNSSWLAWKNLLLTSLWLMFLPNSFYLVTDLVHLHQTYEVSVYFDAVLLMSFIINGFITGFMSLYLVHVELARRIKRRDAHLIIAFVLFTVSFAIFLGRFMRWNSWDVFLHPAGVLFDVSNQFIDPVSPSAFVTTASFFVLLTSAYAVVWSLAMYAHGTRR